MYPAVPAPTRPVVVWPPAAMSLDISKSEIWGEKKKKKSNEKEEITLSE
jgi:hypothetical protein